MIDSQETLFLVDKLSQLLLARKWTVTVAESCTGGGVAYAFTALPGCSDWFHAGFVTYSNSAKAAQLSVSEALLEKYGAVSEEVVMQMAKGALHKTGANIAVAISGVAGPGGGTKLKPVGSIWMSWALKEGEVITKDFRFAGDRREVRQQAVTEALLGLIALTSKMPV